MLLTVQHHPHLGLEVVVSELPEGKGLPGCILQHAKGDADGVVWREACRVDKSGGREKKMDPVKSLYLFVLWEKKNCV